MMVECLFVCMSVVGLTHRSDYVRLDDVPHPHFISPKKCFWRLLKMKLAITKVTSIMQGALSRRFTLGGHSGWVGFQTYSGWVGSLGNLEILPWSSDIPSNACLEETISCFVKIFRWKVQIFLVL